MLYHYTDGDGLLGIVNSNKLWATDIRFLNDSMEYRAGIESLLDFCKQKSTAYEHPHNKLSKALLGFYKILPDIIRENLECRALNVASFTKDRDSLRQWMAYCPKNGGYAIAFDRGKVLLKSRREEVDNGIVCRLEDVDYNGGDLSKMISSDLILKKIEKSNGQVEPVALEILNNLLFHCCAIKNSEFYDERETRLVIQSRTTKKHDLKFRSKSGVIVPYFEYPLYQDCIKEIIIGPTYNMSLARLGLEELLEKKSIDCKIKESKCSLRLF